MASGVGCRLNIITVTKRNITIATAFCFSILTILKNAIPIITEICSKSIAYCLGKSNLLKPFPKIMGHRWADTVTISMLGQSDTDPCCFESSGCCTRSLNRNMLIAKTGKKQCRRILGTSQIKRLAINVHNCSTAPECGSLFCSV